MLRLFGRLICRSYSKNLSVLRKHRVTKIKTQSYCSNKNISDSFTSKMPRFDYPAAREDDITDLYHGIEIKDPYQWMEDPENPEVKKFVDAQNDISRPYLNTYSERALLDTTLRSMWNYPKYSCPRKHGDKYFFYKNTGLQNQNILYVQNSLDDKEEIFLDPNDLSPDGTISLSGTKFSEDGKTFAYGLSTSGSDWITIHFKDVNTGKEYPEVLTKVKYSSIAWTHDNKGIFYGRYLDENSKGSGTETNQNHNQKLYYHYLGTDQEKDILVAEFLEEPEFRIGAEVSDCGDWLILTPIKGCKNNLIYIGNLRDIQQINGQIPLIPVVETLDADYEASAIIFHNLFLTFGLEPRLFGFYYRLFITNHVGHHQGLLQLLLFHIIDDETSIIQAKKTRFQSGTQEYIKLTFQYVTNNENIALFRTNKNAPNYRLISIDFCNPAQTKWRDVIKEHPKDVLDWAAAVDNDKLVVCYIQDVKNILYLYDCHFGEKLYTFPLDMGTITGFSGKRKFSEFFYFLTSFTNPGVIFKVDLSTGDYNPTVFRQLNIPGFNPHKFKTEQVFYPSKDGTKVSMFLVSRADAKPSKNRSCLLYGYGGFNVSIMPTFSLMRITFINHFDGLLAVPNIRGGGEYGEKWHNAGRFFNKQNVFDDFQYAAKYLIEHEHTNSNNLIIQGGSNGGLLVAACMNQNPSLFRAAIAQVGVMDMLRFHKFTIGYAWISDYGSSDDEQHFHNLLSYSPLHNVKARNDCQYPATLLLTADHDDRVVPSHSLKFIATLQKNVGNCPNQNNPLLIRVETKAGHGSGKPTSKIIDECVDILCFVALSLDLQFLEN